MVVPHSCSRRLPKTARRAAVGVRAECRRGAATGDVGHSAGGSSTSRPRRARRGRRRPRSKATKAPTTNGPRRPPSPRPPPATSVASPAIWSGLAVPHRSTTYTSARWRHTPCDSRPCSPPAWARRSAPVDRSPPPPAAGDHASRGAAAPPAPMPRCARPRTWRSRHAHARRRSWTPPGSGWRRARPPMATAAPSPPQRHHRRSASRGSHPHCAQARTSRERSRRALRPVRRGCAPPLMPSRPVQPRWLHPAVTGPMHTTTGGDGAHPAAAT